MLSVDQGRPRRTTEFVSPKRPGLAALTRSRRPQDLGLGTSPPGPGSVASRPDPAEQ